MPAFLALPVLIELAGLIVALGLIYGGKAFVDALLAIVRKVTKAVPFSGFLIGPVAEWALQKLSNKMGTVADSIGATIAGSWNFLATVIERTGWAVFHVAQAAARLQYQIEVAWPLSQLWQRAQDAYHLAARGVRSAKGQLTTTIVQKADTTALRRWVLSQIRAIPHAVAHAAATALPLPHSPLGDLTGALARLRARITKLEAGSAVGLGVVAFALTRLGLGWTRCTNVRRVGRQVCGMDADLLNSLLGATLLLTSAISIEQLARELREPTELVTDGLKRLVQEF